MCGHILKPTEDNFHGRIGSSRWIPMCGKDVSGCAQDLSQATLWVTEGAVRRVGWAVGLSCSCMTLV